MKREVDWIDTVQQRAMAKCFFILGKELQPLSDYIVNPECFCASGNRILSWDLCDSNQTSPVP